MPKSSLLSRLKAGEVLCPTPECYEKGVVMQPVWENSYTLNLVCPQCGYKLYWPLMWVEGVMKRSEN